MCSCYSTCVIGICVLMLLHVCHHTPLSVCVCSCYSMRVIILLYRYVCAHATLYVSDSICVIILLYLCPSSYSSIPLTCPRFREGAAQVCMRCGTDMCTAIQYILLLYICPHNSTIYMCPHAFLGMCVSSFFCIYVSAYY